MCPARHLGALGKNSGDSVCCQAQYLESPPSIWVTHVPRFGFGFELVFCFPWLWAK